MLTITVIIAVVKNETPPESRSTATYCIDPAYIVRLIMGAHHHAKPLLWSRIPNPAPRTRYPAIIGSEALNAALNVLSFIILFLSLN